MSDRASEMDLFLRLNIHATSTQYQKYAELIRERQIKQKTSSLLNDRYRAPNAPFLFKFNETLTPFFDLGKDAVRTVVVPATIAGVPQVITIRPAPVIIPSQ